MGGKDDGPPGRWRVIAGMLVLMAAIGFFAAEAIGVALGYRLALDRPAWALLAVACFYWFGVQLPNIMGGGKDDPK